MCNQVCISLYTMLHGYHAFLKFLLKMARKTLCHDLIDDRLIHEFGIVFVKIKSRHSSRYTSYLEETEVDSLMADFDK